VTEIRHYHWAGLDFMIEPDGTPVLIEANRSSHMLGEYLEFVGDDRPFRNAAAIMNRAAGPACLLWRRSDPQAGADEDACFIARHLAPHLAQLPLICNVEDNQVSRTTLLTRDGESVRPGSIFRWWYALPWSYERSGVVVINPNALWVVVRDKLACYETLEQSRPRTFRVPRAFGVSCAGEAQSLLEENRELFRRGFVLKPRVGWGGQGVQIGDPGDTPREFSQPGVLCERIFPDRHKGLYWEARVFVMAGECLGAVCHVSPTPCTNFWQGARPAPVDAAAFERLRPAALEAVSLIDSAAQRVHHLSEPPSSPLTDVDYSAPHPAI
jgi:hypothetical protein